MRRGIYWNIPALSGNMARKGEFVMEETMLNPLYDQDGNLIQAVCYDDDDEIGDLEGEEQPEQVPPV